MRKNLQILGLSIAILLLGVNAKSQSPVLDWAYNIGGTSSEEAYAQTTDASGNIYTTGSFSSTTDFNPGTGILNLSSAGSTDIFIQKLDRNGNFLWAKKIGGIWADQAYDIAVDNSGNVFITGGFKNTVDFDPGSGVYNLVADNTIQSNAAFILKLNSSGAFQWARKASTVSYGTGVDTDNSGNVYVTGYIQNWVDFGTTSIAGEIFFWKLDANGTQQWAKALDDTNGSSLQAGIHGLKVDATGNIYLTGRFDETQDFQPGTGTVNLVAAGGTDAFLLKLNTSGTLQWVKQFGSTGSETGHALHLDALNQIYITGTYSGITDLDPSSGTGTYSFASNGGTDVFVIKLNSSGNVLWGRGFGGTGYEYPWGNITTDINGNILLSGIFQNTVDFDPDLTTSYNINSNGGNDVFLEKLTSNGGFQWVNTFGSTNNESGWGLCYSSFDNSFYVGGGFYGTMNLTFQGNITTLTSSGSQDIYILKLNECTNSLNTISPVACTSYTSPSGNYTWTTSNTYSDTIPNSGGCDSIITINLTINNPANGTDVITACESYLWIDGNTYTASNNTATYTFPNGAANGCDSIVTLNLTINNPTSGTDVIAACESYLWIDGNTYTASNNTATYTFPNGAANGCDSIVTLNLTINNPANGTDIIAACESYLWIDGNTYTASNNTAAYTFPNGAANGCDSIVTLNLTINTVDNTLTNNNNTLTANAVGATYQWLDCDNNFTIIVGETNQSFIAPSNGNFAVEVSQNGCTDTSSCESVTGLEIDESNLQNSLNVYPNPNNGFFTLEITNFENKTLDLSIVNIMGKALEKWTVNENKVKINFSDHAAGIYFLQLETKKGRITKKLLIQ